MQQTSSHRNAGTSDRTPAGIDPDNFVIEDEFDESLDRHIAAIRESLGDIRNL